MPKIKIRFQQKQFYSYLYILIFYTFMMFASFCITTHVLAESDSTDPETEDVDLAEEYAAQAFQAYNDKDYAKAVALYRKAFEIIPNADVIYNIARIYDVGLRDRPLAINFYRRYIVDPGAVAERVQTANERLVQLRAAEEASMAPSTTELDNKTESQKGIEREEESQIPTAAQKDSPNSNSWSTLRIIGVVSGITGLVTLGIGTGFGIAAMSDADTVKDNCEGNLCTSQEGVDAAESGTTKATISTVGFVVGGGLTVAGVLFWFLGANSESEQPNTVSNLKWTPVASSSRWGLSVKGRW